MKMNLLIATALLVTTACATTKYKTFGTAGEFKSATKTVEGKSPREVASALGAPMSAYYSDDKSTYHMVYPQNETQVSMTDIMFNDRLECLTLNFEKDKGFKYDGWGSDVAATCGALKGKTLDTSLID